MTTTIPASQTGRIEAYRNDFVAVHTSRHHRPDGREYEQSHITVGTGLGVMVIPITVRAGVRLLGVARLVRPTTEAVGYEFPRGGSLDLSADAARSILARETGLAVADLSPLGTFHPENGMVDANDAVGSDGFIDPDTGAVFDWITRAQFFDLILAGHVTDGITLASWALLSTAHPYREARP